MEQDLPLYYDYRKWLAFNDALLDRENANQLYQAVKTGQTVGEYSCHQLYNEAGNRYRIKNGSIDEVEISVDEKENFLAYLKKHYMPTAEVTSLPAEVKDENKLIGNDAIMNLSTQSKLSASASGFFINENIVLHSVGYALIGFSIGQLIALPQFFGMKPPDYAKWILILLLAFLCHLAVRNYKRIFLNGGIRYDTAAKMTLTIFGLIFIGFAFEMILFQLFKGGENFNLFATLVTAAVVVFAGFLNGWVVSLFIYFINGGKVVTDPSSIKKHRT